MRLAATRAGMRKLSTAAQGNPACVIIDSARRNGATFLAAGLLAHKASPWGEAVPKGLMRGKERETIPCVPPHPSPLATPVSAAHEPHRGEVGRACSLPVIPSDARRNACLQEHFDDAAHELHRGEVSEARDPPALCHLRGDPSHSFGMTEKTVLDDV